jgi:adenosine deaminase
VTDTHRAARLRRFRGHAKIRAMIAPALAQFIRRMPKVELHVHLEGAIQPETLLTLARRNGVALPADDASGLQQWYRFTDFPHFVQIYLTITSCICSPEDLEFVAREFLRGQAAQNIRYSEITYTPYTHFSLNKQIPFDEQFDALTRAREWAARELDTHCGWVFDIARNARPVEHCMRVAEWAVQGKEQGVVALGLGGLEVGNPPEWFREAFDAARAAGLASVPHAGELAGAESVRGALDVLQAQRIGHGVRCLEDPDLVATLRERRIPLEVCPSSNVCLGVAAGLGDHPLPRLLAENLYVTINSDDPPMFNTSLTDEYLRVAEAFQFDAETIRQFVRNAAQAALLPEDARTALVQAIERELSLR